MSGIQLHYDTVTREFKGWPAGVLSTIGDIAVSSILFYGSGRDYLFTIADGFGAFRFTKTDSPGVPIDLIPNSDNARISSSTFIPIVINGHGVVITTAEGGGTGLFQVGRRFSDSHPAVGASAEFWPATGQTLPVIAAVVPGGGTYTFQVTTTGSIIAHSLLLDTTGLVAWGTTTTAPALKASGANLQARVGDDSNYTPLEASEFRLGTVSTPDVILFRDAANNLALRNTTSSQIFSVYNTVSGINFEKLNIEWAGNTLFLYTAQGGTGVARNIIFGTSGAATLSFLIGNAVVWKFDASGNFLSNVDGAVNIGASGANRPNTIFSSAEIIPGSNLHFLSNSGLLYWDTRSIISSPADGDLLFRDSTAATFGLIKLGGTTSSFPAIKRSTTHLQVRLADDSDFTIVDVIGVKFPTSPTPSSDVNTFDYYKEGTFTPNDQSGAGLAFAVASGQYVKFGSLVWIGVIIQYPVTASGAAVKIGGLPFTILNSAGQAGAFSPSFTNSSLALICYARENTTNVEIFLNTGAAVTNVQLSNFFIEFGGVYRASA